MRTSQLWWFLGLACIFAAGCGTGPKKTPVLQKQSAQSSSVATVTPAPAPEAEVITNFDANSSIADLREGSRRGDPAAEALLGHYMVYGIRVPQDVEQGLRLLQDSASQGFSHALADLGNLYMNGKYVPRDYEQALHWLNLAAEKNDPDAELDLGRCYQNGLGVGTNFVTAAMWYQRAAEQTNHVAMKNLGVLYMKGEGLPTDYEMAIKWLTPAATTGQNSWAMYDLGLLGENGLLGSNSMAKAFHWYERSAGLGNPMGCWRLAVCYHYGKSVARNQAQYIFWAGEAAAQGVAEAQFFLGEAYRTGDGVPKNHELAHQWFQAAATNLYPDACYNLALDCLQDKTNHEAQVEANRYMLLAAQGGHREAQFQYALSFARGMVVPKDLEQFEQWLKRSAEAGWPNAEFVLAQCLLSGRPPFLKDVSEGEKWLEQAAQHGQLQALDMLAIRLMQGVGVAQNKPEAVKCWRWAAEHGDASGQNDLGYALMTGDAGKVDLVEADMWFQLASNAGIARAKINHQNISTRLTDEEAQQATQRAQNFRPEPMPKLNPVKRDNETATPTLDISARE